MKIDVLASETHYYKHLLPIWAALPDHLRGTVHPLRQPDHFVRPSMGRLAMVAGWQDIIPLRGLCEMIYVEHGAGQSYVDRKHDPSYSASGGQRHRGVFGYISPSETVAARWTNAPSVAVGCPKMDAFLNVAYQPPAEPTVCFAWHWPCMLVPEARTAWPHYEPLFSEIVQRFQAQGFKVLGHEHPKWRGKMNARMTQEGLDVLPTDGDVFAGADILIVDNSSLAFEFALLGRPVVLLNAPWYRRDVEHGLRFWSNIPGLQVGGPEHLMSLNLWDLMPGGSLRPESERLAKEALPSVYAHRDGSSSARAAAFIASLVDKQ